MISLYHSISCNSLSLSTFTHVARYSGLVSSTPKFCMWCNIFNALALKYPVDCNTRSNWISPSFTPSPSSSFIAPNRRLWSIGICPASYAFRIGERTLYSRLTAETAFRFSVSLIFSRIPGILLHLISYYILLYYVITYPIIR